MAPEKEDKHYKPKDAIAELGLVTAISSSVGLFAAAVENATAKTHVGAWGVFTRSGGHIATFGTQESSPLPSSPSFREAIVSETFLELG